MMATQTVCQPVSLQHTTVESQCNLALPNIEIAYLLRFLVRAQLYGFQIVFLQQATQDSGNDKAPIFGYYQAVTPVCCMGSNEQLRS